MSVGLLIISHDGIGPAILGTTSLMLGDCPLNAKLLMASRDCDPAELTEQATEYLQLLDSGDGVLVLTDLYGATPSNIAAQLIEQNNIRVIAGLNLSMLIRVLNYPELDLDSLAEKALSGGRDGVLAINGE